MTIKLGMHSGPQNCTYEELRRLWHIADSSGFYWVSIWDHFYDNPSPDGSGPCFEAVSTLMALAAETRNVRVGSLVFCMGYRHPAVLAKAAVTIDHVSNGRLELGLGAGWFEMEYNAFGIPFPPVKTRLDALEEGVQVIRSMFTQEKTTFIGEHYQLTDAYCSPRPVQQPPRIWVGGGGERRTLRLAARYADGWNVPYIPADRYRHKMQRPRPLVRDGRPRPGDYHPQRERPLRHGHGRSLGRAQARGGPGASPGGRRADRHGPGGHRAYRGLRRRRSAGPQHRHARPLRLGRPPSLRGRGHARVPVVRFALSGELGKYRGQKDEDEADRSFNRRHNGGAFDTLGRSWVRRERHGDGGAEK